MRARRNDVWSRPATACRAGRSRGRPLHPRKSRSAAKALRWAQSVRATIDTLQVSPERCPVDPDSDAYGREVRVLVFGKRRGVYRILFTIEGDIVQACQLSGWSGP